MKKNLKRKLIALVCCLTAAFSAGGLAACDQNPGDLPPGTQEPAEPTQLAAPNISRRGNVVSWTAVLNATGYKYKIDGGVEQTTTEFSVLLTEGQTFQVKAVGDGETYLDSGWSSVVQYRIDQLPRPIVSLSGNVASWALDARASGYVYTINGGEEQEATGNSVTLQDGQSIRVKALGDGVFYKDSLFSYQVNYIEETKYTVSVALDIAGAGVIDGAGAYREGNSADLVAIPNEGYIFKGWYLGGLLVSNSTAYTIHEMTEDVALETKWEKKSYTLTVVSEDEVKGTVTGGGRFEHGDSATLTATATADYTFVGWYEGNEKVSDDAQYTFAVTSTKTLTAKFAVNFCILTLSAEEGGTVSGGGKCALDMPVTVSATATAGYTFSGWYEENEKVSDDAQYTFTATADRTLTAKFTLNSYTITATAEANGTTTSGGKFDHGEEVTLVATPDEGYSLEGWYENGQKVDGATATYTFTATANRTLTAKFVINSYTVSVSANPGGTVSSGGKFDHGTQVSLVATPSAGYSFGGWYENGQKIDGAEATYVFTATADRTLTAKFTSDVCTVSLKATAGGTVSGSGNFDYGTQISVTAMTNTGYTFDGWYEGETQVSTSLTYTFTIENSVELEARWTINSYTLTLNTNMEDVGTVSGAGSYKYGESGTIEATTTNSNFVFAGWYENGQKVSSDASYTVTVTGDRTLTATWEPASVVLTLASDFDIAGTLEGDGVYSYNQAVQLMVTPNHELYTFDGWYNGDTLLSSSPSFLYQIKEDITITAHWQDGWKTLEGYAYWTMPQHGNDVMPIVGFNSPNAATTELGAEIAQVHGSYPSQITDENYRIMQESGINTIVGWWNDWTNTNLQDDILKDMDLAYKYGISYIVNDRPSMKVTSVSELSSFAEYMNKPAYGGTILIDEPGAVNFNDIATATRVWEASTYSDTLAYVNMLPNYAAAWQLNDCQGTGGTYTGAAYSNYEEWIQRYLSIVKPQVFSYDHYPYLFTQPTYFRDGWYTNLSNVRYWTMKAGVPFWVYGQLGGWPEYGQVIDENTQHLTFGHTALQFNSMLSYGAKGIQYYNYFMPPNYSNAGDYTSATKADGTLTPFYAQIQRINKQVAAIDDVLMRCAWKGIIPLNNTPAPISSGDVVSSYGALTSATAVGDAIVGCFEYRDIGYAYYVTTNNVYNASTVTLNFNGNYNLRKVQNGESSNVSASSITLNIDAGDGVLVVVPKN